MTLCKARSESPKKIVGARGATKDRGVSEKWPTYPPAFL